MKARNPGENIIDLGELHYGRKKVQPAGWELRQFHNAAALVLHHALLKFQETEIETIARSFAAVIHERTYTCYGCASMPDHIHLLIIAICRSR